MNMYDIINKKYIRIPDIGNITTYVPVHTITEYTTNTYSQIPSIMIDMDKPYVTDINDLDNEIWFKNEEFETVNNTESNDVIDDTYYRQIQIESMFEETVKIFSNLDNNDNDNDFKKYRYVCSNAAEVLINTMFESQWLFEPMKKILWIYLMLACKYEYRAIKYIISNNHFTNDLFTIKDKYGYTPLYHALLNEKVDVSILHKVITYDILNEIYFDEYPLIVYTILNTNTFGYILYNVPNIQELIYEKSLFTYSCIFNIHTANLLLTHKSMRKQDFDKLDDNNMSCLMNAIIHQPKLFTILHNSEYCTNELFNYNHELYGNILILACRFQPSSVDEILSSQYINYAITKINTNMLINLSLNIKTFSSLIVYNQEIIKNQVVLNDIIHYNPDAFKYLIENDFIVKEQLLKNDEYGISPILFGLLYNFQIFIIIYASKLWSSDLLHIKSNKEGKNILMMLLESNNDTKLCFVEGMYDKGYINKTILNISDSDNFTVFWYFCKYMPKIALKILRNIKLNLSSDTIKKICHNITNIKILKKLVNRQYITKEFVNNLDEFCNNFFMESCYFNNAIVNLLIDYELIDQTTIEQINVAKDNCLLLLLKQNSETTYDSIKKILALPFFNKTIILQKNIFDEFSLLLMCKQKYQYIKLLSQSTYFDEVISSLNKSEWEKCFICSYESRDLELIKTICDHPLFTEEMFKLRNTDDLYIYKLILIDSSILNYIIGHKFCNSVLVNELYSKLLTHSKISVEILESIFNLSKYDANTLLITDVTGNNCLTIAIQNNNISLVKKIIESPLFNKSIIRFNNLAIVNSIEMINLLLNCEHFTTDILLLKNETNTYLLDYYFLNNKVDIITEIIKSDKATIDVLTYKNYHDKSILLELFTYKEKIIDAIMNKNIITMDHLLQTDTFGNTCLHIVAGSLLSEYDSNTTMEDYETNYKDILVTLEKYINSDKLSSNLFEIQNKNGDNFLYINPRLLKIVLNSKYCSPILFTMKNNKNLTLFGRLCSSYYDYVEIFIKSPFFKIEYLLHEVGINHRITALSHICITDTNNIIEYILNMPDCTNELLNYRDNRGFTPLTYCILTQNENNIIKILDSKYDLASSFNYIYNNNRNLLVLAAFVSSKILELLIKSKYTTKEMFLFPDKYNHNLVIYAMSDSVSNIQIITESKFWCDELANIRDIDNDCLMIYPYNKPEIVEYMITAQKCTLDMIKMKNNFGRTCLHYYTKYNHQTLAHMILSSFDLTDIISIQDNEGNTCLHTACQYNIKSLPVFLNSKYITPDILSIQNQKGQNALMILLKYNSLTTLFNHLLKLCEERKDILYQKDQKGKTILFYAARYNIRMLRVLLKLKDCNFELLNHRNNQNMTCYQYTCIHNGESIKYLLKHKETTNNMLYNLHMDYGSCLTLAARYQPIALKYLLEWKPLEWKVIETVFEKENFLTIACKYNHESVKYILETNRDLTTFFTGIYNNKPYLTACQHQPEAIKYLLDSNYKCDNDCLTECINESYECQPKALVYILQKCNDRNLLNIEDDRGYRLAHRLHQVYPNTTIETISNISLTHYTNVMVDEKDTANACNICYTYKKVVLLTPCYHMTCISCAFKLKKCPLCRNIIEDKKVIYE